MLLFRYIAWLHEYVGYIWNPVLKEQFSFR